MRTLERLDLRGEASHQGEGGELPTSSFRTRVARRITILFVICALVPVTVLSLVSYRQVAEQLHEQSRERLRQTGKSAAAAAPGSA